MYKRQVIDTTPTLNSTNLQLDYTFEMDRIMRKDSILNMMCPISNFGNATAADVAAGKTFTSEAGVKVSGTGQLSQFFTGTLRVRSATDIVEFVSPAGCLLYTSSGMIFLLSITSLLKRLWKNCNLV